MTHVFNKYIYTNILKEKGRSFQIHFCLRELLKICKRQMEIFPRIALRNRH